MSYRVTYELEPARSGIDHLFDEIVYPARQATARASFDTHGAAKRAGEAALDDAKRLFQQRRANAGLERVGLPAIVVCVQLVGRQ